MGADVGADVGVWVLVYMKEIEMDEYPPKGLAITKHVRITVCSALSSIQRRTLHTHMRLSSVGTFPPSGEGPVMALPVGVRRGGSSATERWGDSAGVATPTSCGVTASSPASTSSSSSERSGVPAGDTLALEEPVTVDYKDGENYR